MTTIPVFDKTYQETHKLLNDIAAEFGWEENKDLAYDLLRAVLHTLVIG